MMKVKIKSDSFSFENLKFYLVNEYPKIRFWELPKNKLLAEKNKFVGCYVISSKKNIRLVGGFPSDKTNFIAFLILFLGGIIIPLGLYFLIFYKAQKKLETQIGETIGKKFAKYHLVNKTEE
ncbi:MAG: hypothetical protein JXL97_09380 [Bacteroidales bacterium]|nr:hypothetical protein [Bacteroidales bacterium]